MPIYEYECTECGLVDEVVQRMNDKPLTKCRKCSGTVRKLISHSSFHLRGGGWYADSYGAKSGTGSKMTGKNTDSKTETKTTTSESSSGSD